VQKGCEEKKKLTINYLQYYGLGLKPVFNIASSSQEQHYEFDKVFSTV